MIDIELVRKNEEAVAANLQRRGVKAELVRTLQAADTAWRAATEQIEKLRHQQQEVSAKQAPRDEPRTLSQKEKELRQQLKKLAKQREQAWLALPNLVPEDVPLGGEEANKVLETKPLDIPEPDFALQSYLELAEPHLVDLARAAKVSGSRFVYIKGALARLQLGLVSFVFDHLSAAGFTPIIPPVLIGQTAMAGMGYLEHEADEIYKTQDDLYLVGTSEQSIGPMHADEIFDAAELPRRYVGYSTCFRREAGSHGRDVRGILRLHQFDKVEMFSFTAPEESEQEHQFLLQQQRALVEALELPYRVVQLAAGDLGAPASKTFDIETWIPSEGRYRETHSTSNTTDYQARRLNIRVRGAGKAIVKAHMLNGTALAVSRTLIALLENHQQSDGSVRMPAALDYYLPFKTIEP